ATQRRKTLVHLLTPSTRPGADSVTSPDRVDPLPSRTEGSAIRTGSEKVTERIDGWRLAIRSVPFTGAHHHFEDSPMLSWDTLAVVLALGFRSLLSEPHALHIRTHGLAELVIDKERQRKLTDLHGVVTQGAKGSAGKIGSQRTTASASARSNRNSSSPQKALEACRPRNRPSQRRASSW